VYKRVETIKKSPQRDVILPLLQNLVVDGVFTGLNQCGIYETLEYADDIIENITFLAKGKIKFKFTFTFLLNYPILI